MIKNVLLILLTEPTLVLMLNDSDDVKMEVVKYEVKEEVKDENMD